MLPVILYQAEPLKREVLLSALDSSARAVGVAFDVLVLTASAREAVQFMQAEEGIVLIISNVEALRDNPQPNGLKLGLLAMKQNRDHYVVYCLDSADDLEPFMRNCVRPAGVLCAPLSVDRSTSLFRRIMADYQALTGSSSKQMLTFQCGGTLHRVPVQQVIYIEASDKKLNIYTDKQCLTVYESLAALSTLLSGVFTRCHRSYLVNNAMVASADFAEMQLWLTDGSSVPISRSSRALVRALFDGQVGGDAL
jgi:DNA-binding LytR/AlgR family response regulator